MLTLRHVLAVSLAVIAAGCSSSSSQNQRASSASAAVSTAASTAQGAPADAALDVYPGATKLRTQMHGPMSFCGTKMTTVVYRVKDAGAQTVAAWYASHVPGGTTVTIPTGDRGDQSVVEVFQPGGHAAATISQMHFDPRLASAAKRLGADQTVLGIVTFDPPMSSDTIDMVRAAANGDAGAKAKMKAQCADGEQ